MKTSNSLSTQPPAGRGQGINFRAAAFAAILALTLVAAGCGSSVAPEASGEENPEATRNEAAREKESSPLEAVQVAYKNTAEQDTARFSMTINISGMPTGTTAPGQATGAQTEEMRLTSQGAVDFAEGSYALTMRMPYLGQIQNRQVGDTLYQKYPPEFQAQLTDGKPWAKVDLDALPQQQYGAGASGTGGAQSSDPTQQLAYLKSVSDSVEKVGTEDIRGVSTTHYEASIDFSKAAEQDPQARQAYGEIIEELGGEKIPVEVWLDGEGQVRRYEMTMPLILPEDPSSPNSGAYKDTEGSISIVEELYDFGTPVDVEPPPPAQTADVTDMMVEQAPDQL